MDDMCPVCTRKMNVTPGDKEPGGQPISPTEYHCNACGFAYSEHVKYSMAEKANKYREKIIDNHVKIRQVLIY